MQRTHTQKSVDSLVTTTIEAGTGIAVMGGALEAVKSLKK
jgi:hypothetical protein